MGIVPDERGITKDVITEIRLAAESNIELGVWAGEGGKEKEYGSDIDLLIEQGNKQFVWFALQAKILNKRSKYQKLDYSSGGEYQWAKLQRLANMSGCVPYFLFYNGANDYEVTFKDQYTGEIFSAGEYGCSVLPVDMAEEYVKRGFYRSNNSDFRYLHPNYAIRWSRLVHSNFNPHIGRRFTEGQVSSYLNNFKKLTGNALFLHDFRDERFLNADGKGSHLTAPSMETAYEQNHWKPDYIIVLRERTLWKKQR